MSDQALGEAGQARHYGDDETWQALVQVLARLPTDVRNFAVEHCVFLTVGKGDSGYFVPGSVARSDEWIVVFDEHLSGDDRDSAIAREIAHLWLRHPHADRAQEVEHYEDEAAAQVREWGFTGMGATPWADREG